MNREKLELEKTLDHALHYVAQKLEESGHNPKPVLLHSFKVAHNLYKYNYSDEIIVAAALHDLIEDTDVTYEDLKKDFGNKIADIVKAVSADSNIEDKVERAKKMFANCLTYGIVPTVIKCSDLLDNIDFVQFIEDKAKRMHVFVRYELFLEMTRDLIGTTKIFEDLEKKVDFYKKRIY